MRHDPVGANFGGLRMSSHEAESGLGWSFCIFNFAAGDPDGTGSIFVFETDDTSGIYEREAWKGIEMSACSIRIVT